MGRERLFQQIKNGLLEVVFGPETKGRIVGVKIDENVPTYTHFLVETDTGERKAFVNRTIKVLSMVFPDSTDVLIAAATLDNELLESDLLGKSCEVRTRHGGAIELPWLPGGQKLEQDPFSLETEG